MALLGLIEAVSIARAIATHTHQRIDGNQEFIGQGLSNIAGSFFSGYVATGSFNRRSTPSRRIHRRQPEPVAATLAALQDAADELEDRLEGIAAE